MTKYTQAQIDAEREEVFDEYDGSSHRPKSRMEIDDEVIERLNHEALVEKLEKDRNARDHLDVDSLQNCCGIIEIGGFGGTATEIKKSLKAWENYELNGQGQDTDTPAMFIATTIPRQRPAIAALKSCGFEPLASASRPKPTFKAKNDHTSAVTLWVKYLGRKGK